MERRDGGGVFEIETLAEVQTIDDVADIVMPSFDWLVTFKDGFASWAFSLVALSSIFAIACLLGSSSLGLAANISFGLKRVAPNATPLRQRSTPRRWQARGLQTRQAG